MRKSYLRVKFSRRRERALPSISLGLLVQVQHHLEDCIANGLQGWVGIYWPLPGELDLRPLRLITHLRLALPATKPGYILRYHPWVHGDCESILEIDSCGIPAPLSEPPLEPEQLSLLLVPALALDQRAIRLGYGGGYYDRLRSNPQWSRVFALAVLPYVCLTRKPLPRDPWDLPLNGWITERGITLVDSNNNCNPVPERLLLLKALRSNQ